MIIEGRRKNMKQQHNSVSKFSRSKQNKQHQNRVVFKCKKQRSSYIRREVGDLIRKEMGIFFAMKKIEKQMQNQPKDILYMPPKTPMERVNHFRFQQKQKQWEKLKCFKVKNQQRMKRLAKKLKQKSLSHQTKSSQNFMKMSKVHKRYQQIQQKDCQKIQQLKLYLLTSTTRNSARLHSSQIISDQDLKNRVTTAKQITKRKQQQSINAYLAKMAVLEERKIKKQMVLETKRSNTVKNTPKCNIGMRNNKQLQLMNTWSSQFQSKIQKFQRNRQNIQRQRQQIIIQKSNQKNMIKEQVLERKFENEQRQAQKRIRLMEQKINRINNVPGRKMKQHWLHNSKVNFIHKYIKKQKQDAQKEQHNSIMRNVYNIIEKLKTLKDTQQLKQPQIDLLLQNLDPNQNPSDYKEILTFINSTKQKYMEQKRKQEQQKTKKNKKTIPKIL